LPPSLAEIVGIRFPGRKELSWFRAGQVPAAPRRWIVVEREGTELVGEVVVGVGQCVGFPSDPDALPVLLREAGADERPVLPGRTGRTLLDSLP
jgi:hypothetical protein